MTESTPGGRQKSTESIRRVMSASPAAGTAALPALFAISFGGVLALFAAFMFFGIEGWAFGLLAVSQMFTAFGALALGRHLTKRLSGGAGNAAPVAGIQS